MPRSVKKGAWVDKGIQKVVERIRARSKAIPEPRLRSQRRRPRCPARQAAQRRRRLVKKDIGPVEPIGPIDYGSKSKRKISPRVSAKGASGHRHDPGKERQPGPGYS